jgi:hypothetical protein
MHVERLQLPAATPTGLEMTEHDELANSEDRAGVVSDEHVTIRCRLDLRQGLPIVVEEQRILFVGGERTQGQQLDNSRNVPRLSAANNDVRHAGRLACPEPVLAWLV